jgi:8-oxo-dGTP pyrophosphatase MutT (NUDIX family)
MKLRDLKEIIDADPRADEPCGKSGFIPYIFNEAGVPVFMFMVSSNSKYGGSDPAIAKGKVDKGESLEQAGIREAEEELGLKQSNIRPGTIRLAWRGMVKGLDATYEMAVYMGEVKDKEDFDEPHYETKHVEWMTAAEFAKRGRHTQDMIVKAANRLIKPA